MKHRIHDHQGNIRANMKDGGDRPVIIDRTYHGSKWAHEAEWDGKTKVVYPEKPLSCGARVYIETEEEVKLKVRKVA